MAVGQQITDPCLEDRCERCQGRGQIERDLVCWECEGTGFALTDLGRQVFSFLERAEKRIKYYASASSAPVARV